MTSQRRPEKRQSISPSRTQIRRKSEAQTPTIPQSNASAARQPDGAHGERRHHRPHQEAAVAGADQDPVEREDGAVQRLHQREEDPDLLRPLDDELVTRERVRQDALQSASMTAPKTTPAETESQIIRTLASHARSVSPAPRPRPTITWPAIAIASRTKARKIQSWNAIWCAASEASPKRGDHGAGEGEGGEQRRGADEEVAPDHEQPPHQRREPAARRRGRRGG